MPHTLCRQGLLDRNPGVSLAFVGDGPARDELKRTFAGTPTAFLGTLHVRGPQRGGAGARRRGVWARV